MIVRMNSTLNGVNIWQGRVPYCENGTYTLGVVVI